MPAFFQTRCSCPAFFLRKSVARFLSVLRSLRHSFLLLVRCSVASCEEEQCCQTSSGVPARASVVSVLHFLRSLERPRVAILFIWGLTRRVVSVLSPRLSFFCSPFPSLVRPLTPKRSAVRERRKASLPVCFGRFSCLVFPSSTAKKLQNHGGHPRSSLFSFFVTC